MPPLERIPDGLDQWTYDVVLTLLANNAYEDTRFDFKEIIPRGEHGQRFTRNAVGLANLTGGFIVFGVSDDRTLTPSARIVGIPVGQDAGLEIDNLLRRADPPAFNFVCAKDLPRSPVCRIGFYPSRRS